MGSLDFTCPQRARTAEEAFTLAVSGARTVYGSRGETGTIAEKRSWVPIDLVPTFDRGTPGRIRMLVRPDEPDARLAYAREYAFTLCYHEDERITDTDGPAGCFTLGLPGTDGLTDFLFFGWATTPG